jgi:hypothetical protein
MEGSPPDTEGGCEYIQEVVADSRKWVVFQLGRLGVGLKTPHRKKNCCCEMFQSASNLDRFFDTMKSKVD